MIPDAYVYLRQDTWVNLALRRNAIELFVKIKLAQYFAAVDHKEGALVVWQYRYTTLIIFKIDKQVKLLLRNKF